MAWRGFDRAELFLATLALIALELAVPIIALQVYNRVIPGQTPATLAVLVAAGFSAILIEAALLHARARITSFRGFAFGHRTACDANRRLIHADSAAVAGRKDAFLSKIDSIAHLRDFRSGHVLITVTELILLPVVLTLIYLISGWLVLVPIAVLTGFAIFTLVFTETLKTASGTRKESDKSRYRFILEAMQSIDLIKAIGIEQTISRRFETLKAGSTRDSYKVAVSMARLFDLSNVSAGLITYGTVIVGAVLAVKGDLSTGALIATILLSGRLMPQVRAGLALWARRIDYRLHSEDVEELTSLPTLRSSTDPLGDWNKDAAEDAENRGALTVQDVHFRYPDSAPLLRGVSLEAKAGDVVSVTGAAGCGATTLLKIIGGLQKPEGGDVLVNNVPVLDFPPKLLARHVGLIRTHSTIYRGTIMDNLTRFGETPFPDVRYVAGLLQIDRDVASLPGGYDTMLQGNASDPIPPGLKQRIGMVRSLALRPKLILFDNADSALDQQSYELVYHLFDRLSSKITLILCSNDSFLHDLATRHMVLQDGLLVDRSDLALDSPATRQPRLVRR